MSIQERRTGTRARSHFFRQLENTLLFEKKEQIQTSGLRCLRLSATTPIHSTHTFLTGAELQVDARLRGLAKAV